MSNVLIRDLREDDKPFIYNSWLQTYRTSPYGKRLRNDDYYTEMSARIKKFLTENNTLVAVDPEDDNVIWGYLVFEPNTVHYVYTKFLFRRLGIAKALLTYADINPSHFTYTHHTYAAKGHAKKPGVTITYVPY